MSSFFLRIALLIAALALAASTTARAQEAVNGDAGSKVLALERLWGQASHLRDIKALDAIFDDDFVNLDIDGRLMTKAQTLADTLTTGPVEIVVESTGARVHGNTVIVTGVLHLKGVDGGRPYVRRGRFVDTWLYRKGHWVVIASETTPMED
jgi:ketosteroid isomerase-like protein